MTASLKARLTRRQLDSALPCQGPESGADIRWRSVQGFFNTIDGKRQQRPAAMSRFVRDGARREVRVAGKIRYRSEMRLGKDEMPDEPRPHVAPMEGKGAYNTHAALQATGGALAVPWL